MRDCSDHRHLRLATDIYGRPALLDGHVVVLTASHHLDYGDTCVELIAAAHDMGAVVTSEPRKESPNGLSWPGVTPVQRPLRRRR